jgi:hypothetical protein
MPAILQAFVLFILVRRFKRINGHQTLTEDRLTSRSSLRGVSLSEMVQLVRRGKDSASHWCSSLSAWKVSAEAWLSETFAVS